METAKLIECPRDAWQGLAQFIPTAEKVEYLRRLVELGFQHIDAVSFVSPKHVKQMADSEEVMKHLLEQLANPAVLRGGVKPPLLLPKLIGIVVNEKGMERALATPGVTTLGYPYSISAYFRRANANMSRSESRALVEKLQKKTKEAGRGLVVYISMAFGNPYDEPWGAEIVEEALVWLKDIGVQQVSLADTVGTASPQLVGDLYRAVKDCIAGIELGVHLHSHPEGAAEKVIAAFEAGCRRFDSALTGLGGCPFAGDHLLGNIPTEAVVTTLSARGVETGITPDALAAACDLTQKLRLKYADEHGDVVAHA